MDNSKDINKSFGNLSNEPNTQYRIIFVYGLAIVKISNLNFSVGLLFCALAKNRLFWFFSVGFAVSAKTKCAVCAAGFSMRGNSKYS